jgi:hypothetical protein
VIASFDISTHRLDLVLIPLDPATTTIEWEVAERPRAETDATAWSAEAARALLLHARTRHTVAACVVEIPAGRVHPHLAWVYGATHGQCSRYAPTTGFRAATWRKGLGTGQSKADVALWIDTHWPDVELDEHGMDAFCLALYYRQWVWSQAPDGKATT